MRILKLTGLLTLVLFVVCIITSTVFAQNRERYKTNVNLISQGDQILASFNIEKVFDKSFYERISGGLEGRVEIQAQLVDREGSVVGTGERSCKLVYSLWDETLYASVLDRNQKSPIVQTFDSISQALSSCGNIENFPVALAGSLALANGYILYIQVILNPISEEIIERSRQFVANPRGNRGGSSKNLLSAVASLFSRGRKGSTLGEISRFRSQLLSRPPRPDLSKRTNKADSSKERTVP